jgi:hypothetical protein
MAEDPNVREALVVLDRFTAAFNRRDAHAMDETLHFPHFFPGAKPLIWEKPGSLNAEFFSNLVATGWDFSRYTRREAILVSSEQVHFLVEYDRCRADGSVIGHQAAVWIVTRLAGRWGIQVRSNA